MTLIKYIQSPPKWYVKEAPPYPLPPYTPPENFPLDSQPITGPAPLSFE